MERDEIKVPTTIIDKSEGHFGLEGALLSPRSPKLSLKEDWLCHINYAANHSVINFIHFLWQRI